MEVLFIVLPLAILMAGIALAAFFWAVHRGQFDDLDTPRYRALFDDSAPRELQKTTGDVRTNKPALGKSFRGIGDSAKHV